MVIRGNLYAALKNFEKGELLCHTQEIINFFKRAESNKRFNYLVQVMGLLIKRLSTGVDMEIHALREISTSLNTVAGEISESVMVSVPRQMAKVRLHKQWQQLETALDGIEFAVHSKDNDGNYSERPDNNYLACATFMAVSTIDSILQLVEVV